MISLSLKPPHFTSTYGIQLIFTKGGKSDAIKYEFDLVYLRTIINRSRIFKIIRNTPLFINDKAPETVSDEISFEAGSIFYPLELEIDFDGKYLGIYNFPEIEARWQIKKNEFLDYYQGGEIHEYVSQMDQAIATKEQVDHIFQEDLFIKVFFSSLYIDYSRIKDQYFELSFPVSGEHSPLLFNVKKSLAAQLNDYGGLEVYFEGKLNDPRTAVEIIQGLPVMLSENTAPAANSIQGNFDCRYILNEETKSVQSIVANWTIEFEEQKQVQLKIFEIQKPVIPPAVTEENVQNTKQLIYIDGQNTKASPGLFSKLSGIIFGK